MRRQDSSRRAHPAGFSLPVAPWVLLALLACCNAASLRDGAESSENLAAGANEATSSPESAFLEHKRLLPLDARDWIGFACAAAALFIAAAGGIGGGGILVPVYTMVLEFATKLAIPLSNATIFGGAVSSLVLNSRKRHPAADRPLVDWDIIIMMEPLTIAGALVGSLVNRMLPGWLLSFLLIALLILTARRTLDKGTKMFHRESKLKKAALADADFSAPKSDDIAAAKVPPPPPPACGQQLPAPLSCEEEDEPPEVPRLREKSSSARPFKQVQYTDGHRHSTGSPRQAKHHHHGDDSEEDDDLAFEEDSGFGARALRLSKSLSMAFDGAFGLSEDDIESLYSPSPGRFSVNESPMSFPAADVPIRYRRAASHRSYFNQHNTATAAAASRSDGSLAGGGRSGGKEKLAASDEVFSDERTSLAGAAASNGASYGGNDAINNVERGDLSLSQEDDGLLLDSSGSSRRGSSGDGNNGYGHREGSSLLLRRLTEASVESGSQRRLDDLLPSNEEAVEALLEEERHVSFWKVALIVGVFAVEVIATVLKEGLFGMHPVVVCGAVSYWLLTASMLLLTVAVSLVVRAYLIRQHDRKVAADYPFVDGDIRWDRDTATRYPPLCFFAGLFAGLFGIGGGIIKGPIMLEMGVKPQVAAATSATMILFTSMTATFSFLAGGMLRLDYAAPLALIGLLANSAGVAGTEMLVNRHGRHSLIVLSIGTVVLISALLMCYQLSGDMVSGAAWREKAGGICGR